MAVRHDADEMGAGRKEGGRGEKGDGRDVRLSTTLKSASKIGFARNPSHLYRIECYEK